VKIVIVGGGPAGLAAALAMASRGHAADVIVLEKATYPREKPCAGAVSARGLRVLERLGVPLDVPRVVVREVRVRTRAGEARVRLDEGIGVVVRRSAFDDALARAVMRRGVEITEDARVVGVEDRGDSVVVTTERGELEADVVLGADGVGSVVRRAMGLGRGRMRAQVAEVDVHSSDAERAASDVLSFDLSDIELPGYAWSFPTPIDGDVAACRGVYQLVDYGDSRDVGMLLEAIAPSAEARWGRVKRFAERGFDRREAAARGRLLLAGEALGIDPATGEGIAQALEMGARAGAFLSHVSGARVRPERWTSVCHASFVAADLALRARAARAYFDPARRSRLEPLLVDPSIADVGTRLFAGARQSPLELVRAARAVYRARTSSPTATRPSARGIAFTPK